MDNHLYLRTVSPGDTTAKPAPSLPAAAESAPPSIPAAPEQEAAPAAGAAETGKDVVADGSARADDGEGKKSGHIVMKAFKTISRVDNHQSNSINLDSIAF